MLKTTLSVMLLLQGGSETKSVRAWNFLIFLGKTVCMVVCFVLISKDKTSLWITLKPTADLYALSCVFYLSRSS